MRSEISGLKMHMTCNGHVVTAAQIEAERQAAEAAGDVYPYDIPPALEPDADQPEGEKHATGL